MLSCFLIFSLIAVAAVPGVFRVSWCFVVDVVLLSFVAAAGAGAGAAMFAAAVVVVAAAAACHIYDRPISHPSAEVDGRSSCGIFHGVQQRGKGPSRSDCCRLLVSKPGSAFSVQMFQPEPILLESCTSQTP